MKRIILFLVVINLILIAVLIFIILRFNLFESFKHNFNIVGHTELSYKSNYYEQRVSLFDNLQLDSLDVVFVGNSITNGCEWSELLSDCRFKNRGINNDNSMGVLNRIKSIAVYHPDKIFLMIGINDLEQNISQDSTLLNFEKIINIVHRESSYTELFVQSILPINESLYYGTTNNGTISQLNYKLKLLCDKQGVRYCDLSSYFLDKHRQLDTKYTNDGIHLNGTGYIQFKNAIQSYLIK